MKAAVCRQFNHPLSIEEVHISSPQGSAMHVAIKACAICHSDLAFMRGNWGGDLPMVFGHEASGVIKAVGEDVKSFKPGDNVIVTLLRSCGTCGACHDELEAICHNPPDINDIIMTDKNNIPITAAMSTGAFAEEILVHESQCIPLPSNIDYDTASLLGCGVITGFGAVERVGKIKNGEAIAIIGAGGVGINAIQAARIAGASPLIAIDTAGDKEDFAKDLGVTHFINPKYENAHATVMKISKNKGLDAVLVGVGAAKAIEDAVHMIKPGGRVIIMGMPANDDLAKINAADLAGSAKTIIGTKMGSAMIRQDIPRLITLYEQGQISLDRLISHRYPFKNINEAITMAANPQSARVILEFN